MGAHSIKSLFLQKHTLSVVGFIAVSVLLISTAQATPQSGTETEAGSEFIQQEQPDPMLKDAEGSTTDKEQSSQINDELTETSDSSTQIRIITPIEPIKPIAPISHDQPIAEANDLHDSSNVDVVEPEESVNNSNVRIRIRDRSSSEINGDGISINGSGLSLTIKESVSTE